MPLISCSRRDAQSATWSLSSEPSISAIHALTASANGNLRSVSRHSAICTIRYIRFVGHGRSAAEVLRGARVGAGLSQAALATRSGVSQSVISVYEAGRRQPSMPMLASLVEAAGCDLEVRVRPRLARTRLKGPIGRRLLEQRLCLVETAEHHGVRLLGVFGSVARGEETPTSDVDLLVTVPDGMGLIGLGRVEKELSKLLAAPVDLVPADGLKPGVRRNVLADLVVL